MSLGCTNDGRGIENFVLSGNIRSGAAAVGSALAALPGVTCHLNLLHEKGSVRRACHESYFGTNPDDPSLGWFSRAADSASNNPRRYLDRAVFARPRRGETSIGVRIPYYQMCRLDLFDLVDERSRVPGFRLVHVLRNPLACYVSLKQAETSRNWARLYGASEVTGPPAPIIGRVDELLRFVSEHLVARERLAAAGRTAVTIRYRDFYFDQVATMKKVCAFLGRPVEIPPPSAFQRMRNLPFDERVSNFAALRRAVPPAVARFFSDDLY